MNKLRNKKSGRIINSKELLTDEFLLDLFSKAYNYFISKLNKIVEEWEDYEEPKVFWYIYGDQVLKAKCDGVIENMNKPIGNYFETEEEAEKAIEKLKAWKRLKDKGFKFGGGDDACISYEVDIENWTMQDLQDFAVLFGGEE